MISLIISMVALIIFTPIIFNFRSIFGIGVHNIEDDYFNSYSDGTAGINLHLRFNREFGNRYAINTIIEPISTGDVVNYGIISIDIRYFNDNESVFGTLVQFDPPRSNYSVNEIFLNLFKYSNLTCYGTIEISLETGGTPINDTINFQLTFIVPLGAGDYTNIDLMIYSLMFFHLFLYIIIPVALIWIFRPVLRLTYDEEDEKRDKKFLNYLKDLVSEKRKESKH